LNKFFKDRREPLNVEDTNQKSGIVVSTPTKMVHNAAEQKAISIQKKDRTTVRSRKLARVCIFSIMVVIILVVVAMTFVVLELDFYGSHRECTRKYDMAQTWATPPQFFSIIKFCMDATNLVCWATVSWNTVHQIMIIMIGGKKGHCPVD
jgi:hypothetical protein